MSLPCRLIAVTLCHDVSQRVFARPIQVIVHVVRFILSDLRLQGFEQPQEFLFFALMNHDMFYSADHRYPSKISLSYLHASSIARAMTMPSESSANRCKATVQCEALWDASMTMATVTPA